jgi:endonuclease YncB( thermonuclease family)
MRFLVLLAFALWCVTVGADPLEGRVVAVADGGTITLLDSNRQQHRIRLAGIDAPEKAQPFGQRLKQHLAELVFGKNRKRIAARLIATTGTCATSTLTERTLV